jgi:hypothetical protein
MNTITKTLVAALAVLGAGSVARAQQPDARMNAIMTFCQTDTAIPAQTVGWLDPAPDGNIRGPRPAAVLYGEAKKAQAAGDNLNAVRWILLCEAHDPGSYQHIANNNGMVIQYLASH